MEFKSVTLCQLPISNTVTVSSRNFPDLLWVSYGQNLLYNISNFFKPLLVFLEMVWS